jgi:transposase
MEEKTERFEVNRYSLEFKHLICKEHIEQGTGLNELKRKYQLSSHSLIHEWLRKYKYLPAKYRFERKVKEICIENYTQPAMPILPPSNQKSDSQKEDNSELKRLKKELEDAKILAEGYERMIEIAEQEYKISIRKKPNTK